ncbi:hypothetical protein EMPS_00247 [Entomortierella parvispora]|uniref:Inner centromere protein ARK-binding domain-containing protein n=1 Tax=Entomortierella parvispora TaxID=205924 RepID=A0A9P3LR40_9FUNG|nr:hypothetical protein EMPS_00247 [Entomortierella parvispora]
MDYRLWAQDQDNPPEETWPLPYKRELARLKDQRLDEFKSTMNVNFGWLQDYYEGFRWSAMHRFAELDQAAFSCPGGIEVAQKQQLEDDDMDYPYDMAYNSGLKTPTQTYTGRGSFPKSPGSFYGNSRSTRKRPSMDQFRLKTPKTPRGMIALRSPRSPFERHRFTPRRTKLRVSTSAFARKGRRSLKSMHKKSTGAQSRGDGTVPSKENQRRGDISIVQSSERDRGIDIRSPSTNSRSLDTMRTQPRHISTEDMEDRKSVGWGFLGDRDDGCLRDDEDEDVTSPHTTPVSRARDSMQLFSPPLRPNANRNSYYSLTPELIHGQPSSPRMFKRGNTHLDFDQTLDLEEAEFKRPKGSPFLDSTTPVRFSPERESYPESELSKPPQESERPLSSPSWTSDCLTGSDSDRKERVDDPFQNKNRNQWESNIMEKDCEARREPSLQKLSFDRRFGERVASADPIEGQGRKEQGTSHRLGSNSAASRKGLSEDHRLALRPSTEEKDRSKRDIPDLTQDSHAPPKTSLLELSKKTRVTNTLPEKRTVFQRNRLGHGPVNFSAASVALSSSRLTKVGNLHDAQTSDTPRLTTSTAQGATNTGAKFSRTALQNSRDGKSTPTLSSGKATQTSSSTSVAAVLRQGVPRALLPSMRPTESSLARTGSQPSLVRKPFQTSKSTLSLKKPVRPVLPDSTLTAKSISLSQSDGLKETRPPASPKREKREMTPLETRLRELGPDMTVKTLNTTVSSADTASLKETRSTPVLITGPLLTAQSNTKPTSTSSTTFTLSSLTPSNIAHGKKASQRLQDSLLQMAQNSRQRLQNGQSTSTSALTVDIEQKKSGMSWSASSTIDQRPSNRTETILPEISIEVDDDIDDMIPMKANSRYIPPERRIPPWAEWDELEKALRAQASINPQEIFGALPTLDIASMLPQGNWKRQLRLSSAQWGTTDQLTKQEILKYNTDMGWSASE